MTFDAYVTEIIFDRAGRAWFALGDGTIAGETGERVSAHDGAVLAAAAHPSGEGVVSGGDDGRLVWTRDGEAKVLAEIKGRWIDAVASSTASGLIGFAAGREAHVRDVADAKFARVFAHEKTVAHLAFDPKGRRLLRARACLRSPYCGSGPTPQSPGSDHPVPTPLRSLPPPAGAAAHLAAALPIRRTSSGPRRRVPRSHTRSRD